MKSTEELGHILIERSMTIMEAALERLAEKPHASLPAVAVVVNEDGDVATLLIPQVELRLVILAKHAKEFGTVGFALVYDGLVSAKCLRCLGRGCDQCQTLNRQKTDAVITVIRTAWGFGATKGIGYGYDAEDQFILIPAVNIDLSSNDPVLDGYEAVFGTPTVH